jgi:hypothetical protein
MDANLAYLMAWLPDANTTAANLSISGAEKFGTMRLALLEDALLEPNL